MTQDGSPKVAVVGAGIVGVSCALHLQRLGAAVILIDRGEPGHADAASYGNGGILARSAVVPVATPGILRKAPSMLFGADGPLFLRWSYLPRLLPWLVPYLRSSSREKVEHIARNLAPLLFDSVDEHRALAQGTEAGRWLRTCEYVYLYDSRDAFERDAFGWDLRREHGFEWDTLEGGAIRDFDPALSSQYGFAVRLKDHGMVAKPGNYVSDLAKAFAADGGEILQADIKHVETSGDGVILKTHGDDIETDKVVIAAGAWSKRLAVELGSNPPLDTERGYHVQFPEPGVGPRLPVYSIERAFVASPLEVGLRVAGTVELGGLNAAPNWNRAEVLLGHAKRWFPGLETGGMTRWMGFRPSMPDSLPVIGRSPRFSNVIFAFGHGHCGMMLGARTGEIVAALHAKRDPGLDLSPYRIDRF